MATSPITGQRLSPPTIKAAVFDDLGESMHTSAVFGDALSSALNVLSAGEYTADRRGGGRRPDHTTFVEIWIQPKGTAPTDAMTIELDVPRETSMIPQLASAIHQQLVEQLPMPRATRRSDQDGLDVRKSFIAAGPGRSPQLGWDAQTTDASPTKASAVRKLIETRFDQIPRLQRQIGELEQDYPGGLVRIEVKWGDHPQAISYGPESTDKARTPDEIRRQLAALAPKLDALNAVNDALSKLEESGGPNAKVRLVETGARELRALNADAPSSGSGTLMTVAEAREELMKLTRSLTWS